MEKFNRYWMLKYSELRSQLQFCRCCSKDVFLDSSIIEITYPKSFRGPQVRYTFLNHVVSLALPEGVVIQILSREEKSRLYSYYQLDKSLSY